MKNKSFIKYVDLKEVSHCESFTLFDVFAKLLAAAVFARVRDMMASTRLRRSSRSFSSFFSRSATSIFCLSASSRAFFSCSSRS